MKEISVWASCRDRWKLTTVVKYLSTSGVATGEGSDVARGRGHAPWVASLRGAPAHFLQSFKNTF